MSNEELIAEAERARGAYSLDSETVALIDRVIDALKAAERKPVIDREALARVLDEQYDHYSPTYNEQGECVNSTMADAVIASGLIEDKREAQAEALEAAADATSKAANGAPYEVWAWCSDWLRARASEIREGRA